MNLGWLMEEPFMRIIPLLLFSAGSTANRHS